MPDRTPTTLPRARTGEVLVLLHRFTRDITRIAAGALGDDLADNRLIMVLTLVHEGPMSPSELCARTGLSRSAMSRLLGTLDEHDLISRQRQSTDGRSVDVSLTRAGRRRLTRLEDELRTYLRTGDQLIPEALALLDVPAVAAAGDSVSDMISVVRHLSEAGARYGEDVAPVADSFGITDTTARFAVCLIEASGTIRPTAIGRELGLASAGVSAVLDRLDSAGLIIREHDTIDHDRRSVVVQPSPLGRRAASAIYTVFARHQHDVIAALALTRSLGEAR